MNNLINNLPIFKGVNVPTNTIGDLWFDTTDNNYKIVTPNGTLTVITPDDTSLNRDSVKQYLKNDPELLNELLLELRREKINKIIK